MGRRGPSKKPTELKLLEGVPGGKHKLNLNEPKPPKAESLKPPRELTKFGRKIWKQLTPKLEPLNLVTNLDLHSLMRYCDCWDKFLKTKKLLDDEGFCFTIYYEQTADQIAAGDPKEIRYTQQRPEVSIYFQLMKDLARFDAQFGLTPAARANLNIKPIDDGKGKNRVKARLYG